jgi:tRNA dimethylallyltransferase
MFEAGWMEEKKKLLLEYGAEAPALKSIGYAEIIEFLTKEPLEQNFEHLKEQVFIRHRQLAKQQRTWLKKLLSSK